MSDADKTQTKDQRVVMMMTRDELKAVDDWRFARRISSRGEAIRQLIAMSLKASAGKRVAVPPAKGDQNA